MCQLAAPTLLSCQLWAWCHAYSTTHLALWLLCARRNYEAVPSAVPWAVVAALLLAYGVPLALTYYRELSQRTNFAASHAPTLDQRWMRAWVDADFLAPIDMLLPAGVLVCWACL